MKDHLREAAGLIDGERAEQHGDAQALHARVAWLWNAYLRDQGGWSRALWSGDVLIMMALLKIARTTQGRFNRDDYIDALGYIALAARIDEARYTPADDEKTAP